MIKIYTTIFLVLSFAFVSAQTLDITSQYGIGSAVDDFLGIYPSPVGDGYYLIGTSNGNTSFDKTEDSRGGNDIWIVKTDNNFVKQWDKTFGGDENEMAVTAVVFSDRIVINSTTSSNTSGDKTMDLFASAGYSNIWNICIDLSGNLLWQFQYGGDVEEANGGMIKYSDTSVLMAISSRSGVSGNKSEVNFGFNDIWLVEAAINDGHIIQQNNVGSSSNEQYAKLATSPLDGKLFMVCVSRAGNADFDKTDPGFNGDDYWLTELSSNLNVVNDKCFGGDNSESFPNINFDINGNIIISGSSQSDVSGNKTAPKIGMAMPTATDCWILKVDTSFNLLWDKGYGGTLRQLGGTTFPLSTGEVVASCMTASNPGTGNQTSPHYGLYDVWILILDSNGDIILQSSFGGSQYDYGAVIPHPVDPTKLLLSGNSNSPVSGNKTIALKGGYDNWLGVLEYDPQLGVLELVETSKAKAFPNPSGSDVTIEFTELKEPASIAFYSEDGKLLDNKKLIENTSSIKWNTKYQGIVFYTIEGENTFMQGKLVFE